jgi:hypothetical protein
MTLMRLPLPQSKEEELAGILDASALDEEQ